jgi:hypothetical protein
VRVLDPIHQKQRVPIKSRDRQVQQSISPAFCGHQNNTSTGSVGPSVGGVAFSPGTERYSNSCKKQLEIRATHFCIMIPNRKSQLFLHLTSRNQLRWTRSVGPRIWILSWKLRLLLVAFYHAAESVTCFCCCGCGHVGNALALSLDEHVVHPPTAAVHGDPDSRSHQYAREGCAGELAALISIEDLRLSKPCQRLLERPHAERAIHGVGQAVGRKNTVWSLWRCPRTRQK